jgi:hypothetical protein
MKKLVPVLIFCFLMVPAGAEAFYYGDVGPPGLNEVHIGKTAIVMPLGKILLVRRGSDYCAIKFLKFWTGITEQDVYATCESYYQGDKSGDFSKKDLKITKDKLSFPKPRGIGRLAFSFGNRNIHCGPLKLEWAGRGSVFFYAEDQKEGDYRVELAPTHWTDISQINVFDSRLKWYTYDEKRPRVNIPVDRLFEDK